MISVRVMRTFFGLGLLFFSPLSMQANKSADKKSEEVSRNWDDCPTKVHFKDLTAKCVRTKNLNVENVGCVSAVNALAVCTDSLQANQACLNNLSVNGRTTYSAVDALNGCFDSLNANNLCVSNITIGNSLIRCVKFSATAVVSADYTYTLGDDINYDLVVEDPNNNIVISPTRYTVPLTGYYLLSTQVDITNVQSLSPILGTPVAVLSAEVNGIKRRETFAPFLSFNPTQKTNLSGLFRFNAGDIVTIQLDVQVVDPVLGVIDLVGTATILGNGTEEQSLFSVMYLGSTCDTNPCVTCTPVVSPCTTTCAACVPCVACPCN